MAVWLRADRAITSDGSGNVQSWGNFLADGQDVTQATVGKQPLVVANALGGQPVIRFDGVDDSLLGPTTQAIAKPYTAFVVFQRQSGSYGSVMQGSGAGSLALGPFGNDEAGYRVAGQWVGTATAPAVGVPELYTAIGLGTESRFYRYGNELTTTPLATGNLGRLVLGGVDGWSSDPGNNDIAEVIIYNRVLSDSERQGIESYLLQRYSLPHGTCSTRGHFAAGRLVWQRNQCYHELGYRRRKIRYTLDGSEPTASSALYNGSSLTISATAQLRSRAFRTGYAPSSVSSGDFIIDFAAPSLPQRDHLKLWLRGSQGVVQSGGKVDAWNRSFRHGSPCHSDCRFRAPRACQRC